MDYLPLGASGLTVSRVGFGCRGISGDYGPVDEATARATVNRALDLGVTLFETAPEYRGGHIEELLADILPRSAALAIQVDAGLLKGGPDAPRRAVEASLARLRREAMDLLVVRGLSAEMAGPEMLAPLEDLRSTGLVRALAASVHYVEDGLAAIGSKKFGVLQFPCNILSLSPGQVFFDLAAQRGIGLMAREALSYGLLAGIHQPGASFPDDDLRSHVFPDLILIRTRVAQNLSFLRLEGRTMAQAALRYVLDLPQVHTVLAGAKTPQQVEENVGALASPSITLEEHHRIRETLTIMAHWHF